MTAHPIGHDQQFPQAVLNERLLLAVRQVGCHDAQTFAQVCDQKTILIHLADFAAVALSSTVHMHRIHSTFLSMKKLVFVAARIRRPPAENRQVQP